jgi:hypothetical protein
MSRQVTIRPDQLNDRAATGESVEWDRIHAASSSEEERADLILYLAEENDQHVPQYLVDQLRRSDLSPKWRNALIFAAEAVEVLKPETRTALAQALLARAQELNGSGDAQSLPALWVALRRFVSLAGPEGLTSLTGFLSSDRNGVRQVVLQTSQNAFASAPPGKSLLGQLHPLTVRVSQLAGKYLDPDWLISPQNAALAMNALHAAAVLGDANLISYSHTLSGTGKDWLIGRIRRALQGTREAWSGRAVDGDTDAAIIRRLDEAIAVLGTAPHSHVPFK